jgi:hypothetical protein
MESVVNQFQKDVADILADFQLVVESLGTFAISIATTNTPSGAQVEIKYLEPNGVSCFRKVMHFINSQVTFEYFQTGIETEKHFLGSLHPFTVQR